MGTKTRMGTKTATPAFLNSKSKTIKWMTGRELVSLVVAMIQSSKVASRWDSANDYPKASELRQLVSTSEGVFDFSLRVLDRYCGESNHVRTMKNGRVVEISDKDFQRLGRNKSGREKVTDLRTGEKVVATVTSYRLL